MDEQDTKQLALSYPGFQLGHLRGFLMNSVWQRYGALGSVAVEKAHDMMAVVASRLQLVSYYQAGFDTAKGTSYEHLRLHREDQAPDFTQFLLYIQLYKNDFEHVTRFPYCTRDLRALFRPSPNQFAPEAVRGTLLNYLDEMPDDYRASFHEARPGGWDFAIAVPGKNTSTVIRITRFHPLSK